MTLYFIANDIQNHGLIIHVNDPVPSIKNRIRILLCAADIRQIDYTGGPMPRDTPMITREAVCTADLNEISPQIIPIEPRLSPHRKKQKPPTPTGYTNCNFPIAKRI